MLADGFLHPHHVVPLAEFIGAVMEFAHVFEAKMLMELHAVLRQVFILNFRIGDTGVEI